MEAGALRAGEGGAEGREGKKASKIAGAEGKEWRSRASRSQWRPGRPEAPSAAPGRPGAQTERRGGLEKGGYKDLFPPEAYLCVCVGGAIDKHKSNMLIKIYSMPVSGKYYWEK